MATRCPSSGPNDPLPPGIEGDSLWIAPARAEDYPPGREPPSILVLTKDEEVNIEDCLATLAFSDDIVVLDSYSTDRTGELARRFPGVRFIKRTFDTWSKHSNWALENIHFKHRWVYYSDADERMPPALRDEIVGRINDPAQPHAAFRLKYQNMFLGRWIRRGGLYPVWIIRLFRPDLIRYEDREVNAHPVVQGSLGDLDNDFIHYSFNKGLLPWYHKHNAYSDMEANEAVRIITAESAWEKVKKLGSRRPGVGRRALKDLSFFMPVRGILRFMYMYLLRLGILDALPGFHYALMISMYEYWIEVKIRERRSRWREETERTVERLLAEGEGAGR